MNIFYHPRKANVVVDDVKLDETEEGNLITIYIYISLESQQKPKTLAGVIFSICPSFGGLIIT